MSFVMAKAPRSAGQRLLAAVLTAASLKRLWRLVCLNAFGAVGYLLWGRQQT